MLPFVSCLCPTYNRVPAWQHLLEEALESFVRQDYPLERRELVLLTDAPRQELVCTAAGVRIAHAPVRFASLGEKYNRLVELARGELLLPWEDDDISLPGRISQAVHRLGDAPYWNPQRTWFLEAHRQRLHHDHLHGVCHHAAIFRRSAWAAVGGYPAISGAQDQVMDGRLKALAPPPVPLADDPAHWQYLYRWGVSPCHLSGRAAHDAFYHELGAQPVAPGQFVLTPHWRADYAGWCAAASAARRSPCSPPS